MANGIAQYPSPIGTDKPLIGGAVDPRLARYQQTYKQGQRIGGASTAEEAFGNWQAGDAERRYAEQQDALKRQQFLDDRGHQEALDQQERDRQAQYARERPSISSLTSGGSSSGSGSAGGSGFDEAGYRSKANIDAEFKSREAGERDKRMRQLMSEFGLNNDLPEVTMGGGPSAFDEEAARTAAFARAKEQAGMTARASMTALEDVAAERGLTGSTLDAQAQGAVVGGARADINDFTREQLTSDLGRAKERANTTYQGQLAQRAQNQARRQSMMSLLQGLY